MTTQPYLTDGITPQGLIRAHRETWEREVQAKFRRLFQPSA